MIQREPYSYPADCWSFGVIVHQLLALERPFDGNSTADLVKSILSADPPPLPVHYSEEIKYAPMPIYIYTYILYISNFVCCYSNDMCLYAYMYAV